MLQFKLIDYYIMLFLHIFYGNMFLLLYFTLFSLFFGHFKFSLKFLYTVYVVLDVIFLWFNFIFLFLYLFLVFFIFKFIFTRVLHLNYFNLGFSNLRSWLKLFIWWFNSFNNFPSLSFIFNHESTTEINLWLHQRKLKSFF